jgi:hypothetical protein
MVFVQGFLGGSRRRVHFEAISAGHRSRAAYAQEEEPSMILGRSVCWWFSCILPLVAAGIASPGCSVSGEDSSRQPLAGRVLFEGKPLAHGTIMFFPEDPPTKEHESVMSGSVIRNGRFSIPSAKGLLPGKYKISVSSQKKAEQEKESGGKSSPGRAEPAAIEEIPERFNAKTELEIEIKEERIKELRIDLETT